MRARACVRACVLEVKKKTLNEVPQCVYAISRVHCALACVYRHFLLALFFFYRALRAHVRCKRLTNILLHYIIIALQILC